MAAYEYIAIDSAGKRTKGVISADTSRGARKELRLRHLMPVEISPLLTESAGKSPRFWRGMSEKDRAVLTRQLAVLLQSGLQVEQALTAASSDDAKPSVRRTLLSVRSQVTEGVRLADALATAPRAFPPLYQAVVSAGESSGRLDDVLDRLAVHLEKAYRLRRKVQSALIYPALLAVMAFGMVAALMVFVVPRLVEQFDVFGSDLPWLTRQVIALSNFARDWGLLVVFLVLVLAIILHRALKAAALKRSFDRIVLNLPIIGSMVQTVSAARFARIFATLSGSGATVLESLSAANGAMNNLVFKDAADQISERVREGGSFSAALRQTNIFPPMMVHMVASGEVGRNLPGMMTRSAEFLEEEFETSTETSLSLLEPLIILVLGGIVGLIVLSIMLPIIQLNTLAIG